MFGTEKISKMGSLGRYQSLFRQNRASMADGKYHGGETKNGALETGSARSSSAQSLPGALDLSDRPANLGRQEHLTHSLEKSAKTPVFDDEEEDSEMDYHFFEFDDILRHLLKEALISPE